MCYAATTNIKYCSTAGNENSTCSISNVDCEASVIMTKSVLLHCDHVARAAICNETAVTYTTTAIASVDITDFEATVFRAILAAILPMLLRLRVLLPRIFALLLAIATK